MDPINKKALRAAVLIHEHLAGGNRHDAALYLPEYSWHNIQQLRRRIELARRRSWHRAAARTTEVLTRALDDCHRNLENALRTLQSCPVEQPVASASDIYRDILALCEEFDEVDIHLDEHAISVTTDYIVLEHVNLGRFQVRLDWKLLGCCSQPYGIVARDPHPAAARDDVTHPHVQDGQLCEGEGRLAIHAALVECRLFDFFLMVNQLLHTYGQGSAYVELDRWNGVPCDDCGDSVNEDDRYCCHRYEATLCSSCSVSCQDCGDSYCSGCLGTCAACGYEHCSSCLATCPVCRKRFCEDCREDNICLSCHQEQRNAESEHDPSENARNEPVAARA